MKVLLVNEFSQLTTGYSVYGRHLLNGLCQNYEVAELACYADHNDPRSHNLPWRVYSNTPQYPDKNYDANPSNVFGKYKFDDVCRDFKPDYVLDIRDEWMMNFEFFAPYRDNYRHIIMPTVDARNQNEQWLFEYSTADAVLTYQNWSGKVLNEESGGKINWVGEAPPGANENFHPLSSDIRQKLKTLLNNKFVIGFVSRNQPRKRFPELFQVLAEIRKHNSNVVLYCHTSYPDRGWDFPKLLNMYGVADIVYFTYICQACGDAAPSLFKDEITQCPNCKQFAFKMPNTSMSLNDNQLNLVYNMMDLHIQYSNSEGFGLATVEAAACGTPVMGTGYSAMEDTIPKLLGQTIDCTLYMEMETGCYRAIPNHNDTVQKILTFIDNPTPRSIVRDAYELNYGWDKTINKWKSVISGVPNKVWQNKQFIPPDSLTREVMQLSNSDFVKWLIIKVLHKPILLNTYFESNMIKNLNYKQKIHSMHGFLHNDESYMFNIPKTEPFNKEIAYKYCLGEKQRESIIYSSL